MPIEGIIFPELDEKWEDGRDNTQICFVYAGKLATKSSMSMRHRFPFKHSQLPFKHTFTSQTPNYSTNVGIFGK